MNFIQLAIEKGFNAYGLKLQAKAIDDDKIIGLNGFAWATKNHNPNNNWFGVSVYEPDLLLVKDEKTIHLSLQGVSSKWVEKYEHLFQTGSIKYICFRKNDSIEYEDWTGVLPTNEFIQNFLNNKP